MLVWSFDVAFSTVGLFLSWKHCKLLAYSVGWSHHLLLWGLLSYIVPACWRALYHVAAAASSPRRVPRPPRPLHRREKEQAKEMWRGEREKQGRRRRWMQRRWSRVSIAVLLRLKVPWVRLYYGLKLLGFGLECGGCGCKGDESMVILVSDIAFLE